jgi:hypothetical protein
MSTPDSTPHWPTTLPGWMAIGGLIAYTLVLAWREQYEMAWTAVIAICWMLGMDWRQALAMKMTAQAGANAAFASQHALEAKHEAREATQAATQATVAATEAANTSAAVADRMTAAEQSGAVPVVDEGEKPG